MNPPTRLQKASPPSNSLLSSAIFPGRHTLTIQEVAKVVCVTPRHIADLCAEGTIKALNVGGDANKTKINFWRIPVAAYDAWIEAKTAPAY